LSNTLFEYKITPEKKLGQNFLINDLALDKIIYTTNLKNKNILEIGTGTGIITKKLLELGKSVTTIEIDKKLVNLVKKEFSKSMLCGKLNIINGDILKLDLKKIVEENNIDVIVSAPPYYISTPLIYAIITLPVKEAVLLMQKDFLDKIRNDVFYSPSALSVITYYFTKPEFKDIISAESFEPKPKVESQIMFMKFRNKKELSKTNEPHFIEIIKQIFRYPNKSFRKSLLLSLNMFNNRIQKHLENIIDSDIKQLDMKITEISGKDYIKILKIIEN
jgi:16S rRNA (adenine1518-N6/adenine1519-N6)-dimethyltransferase